MFVCLPLLWRRGFVVFSGPELLLELDYLEFWAGENKYYCAE